MNKSPTFTKGFKDIFRYHHSSNRLVSSPKPFTHSLYIGCKIWFCLSCMQSTSSTHSAHYLINHEKNTVFPTNCLHSFKITRNKWNTAKSSTNHWFRNESTDFFGP
uniref:hypothetical protein n=1 Tax=Diaporthe sojae TaxID=165439 RepID=UPI00240FF28E|nr:hypothetical protein QAZ32_mgp19 [Diaporthe sojae]WET30420.1 hypothetical protein [Diaporthe sojae]